MPYRAPVSELRFVLDHIVGFDRVAATDTFAEATPDMVEAILTEAGKMCEEVLSPLNRAGDITPAALENGVVRTSPGFGDGFRAIADGGWIGMSADPEYGGMGLPITLTMAVNEMIGSGCLALQLNPLMTQGQIEALEAHASPEIQDLYIPKLVSGEWCGTMNLTEPQAGSDVGALKSKAEDNGDGTYAVTGQKIYISWGDNDFSENICHLVLARLPDGAEGTRGISLFMVPKWIPDADGKPGVANTLKVVSLEHKLGLHGSPTAVMQYDGATGWLVGEPHKGMAAMFTMMNNARLGVGVQGLSVAEAALQHAIGYAMDRKQGKTGRDADHILEHADVRRMVLSMKADIFATRALAMDCAVSLDMAKATGDAAWKARGAFLTPIAKAFGTDTGIKVAGDGIQVHGGMGFVEETGAAQFLRDVRVTAIYEGTNGIQAMDLVGRKLMDRGAAAFALLDEVEAFGNDDLTTAATHLRKLTEWMLEQDMQDRFAGAVSYLGAFARVLGAFYHLKAAAAETTRAPLAAYAAGRMIPEAMAEMAKARTGAAELYAVSTDVIAA
ncbi:acyl-CoA dehydrogenase family protein [Jannaschia donghaensis]|uniref:3-methylmercaptopropionyl-CoA dehydrogenase n=1 Tax=Jannaschia donghaensis TaxID=420998 RepID=A0A0M6YFP7_9RHOB|nr:acyl-CoA dehydrogenase family protein [Jannaschia donghaensis]CTQ48495.1 Acyl-CoA dehydrogenase [Jannaschia donghaensis]